MSIQRPAPCVEVHRSSAALIFLVLLLTLNAASFAFGPPFDDCNGNGIDDQLDTEVAFETERLIGSSAPDWAIAADLDGDGDTDGINEQVRIRHLSASNRIEWRRSATGPYEILAVGITNDADGNGTEEPMFTADSTTNPTRIEVRITAESIENDPVKKAPLRFTIASEITLRNVL